MSSPPAPQRMRRRGPGTACGDGPAGRWGFTLPEVLVVIAIVATASMVLLPVLTGVRAYGVRLRCAVNLRHIGAAAGVYATDNWNALPTHYADPTIVFDTFRMRQDGGELVNLGLLVDYASQPQAFYCPGQDASLSPAIAFDTPENGWSWGQSSGGGGGGNGPGPGSGAGLNASFAARCRWYPDVARPKWTLLNYANMVIYTDFIGVDKWPGRGRFGKGLCAPHRSAGYNRLFGDGSALWAPSGRIGELRPVNAVEPTPQELSEYFKLLDVLP